MKDHFVEYASYFILDRAIPDSGRPEAGPASHPAHALQDERRPLPQGGQRYRRDDEAPSARRRASIGDALVVLANKEYFIERQGNFGNLLTGHPAAFAARYRARVPPGPTWRSGKHVPPRAHGFRALLRRPDRGAGRPA
ncbi:MAG: hypothetical protein R3E53_07845 [Myxococcota bacterium]